MYAVFSLMLFSETSMQSQVSPSSSPIRREQEKARLIASDSISSSHTSRACSSVSRVHISRTSCSSFGSVAFSTGFRDIISHLTAWLKALLRSLCISLTVCTVRYSFLGLRLFTTFAFTLKRLWKNLSIVLGLRSSNFISPISGLM